MQNDENTSQDNGTSRMIRFENKELSQFPEAGQSLAILIPAVQDCYMLWNPIKNDISAQNFEIHLIRSMASAAHVYQQMREGHSVDLTAIAEMDVPHVTDIVTRLAKAFDECRHVWSDADLEHIPFINRVMSLMHLIVWKMYNNRWQ